MTRRLTRLAAAVALGGTLVVGGAAPALAHNQLISTTPADASTVATAPASVTMTFDLPCVALGTEVVVTGPTGARVSSGPAQLVNTDVTENLTGSLPAGRYTVQWRVTSADGHPVAGTFSYTASAPGQGAAPAATTASASAAPGGSTSRSASSSASSSNASSSTNGLPVVLAGAGLLAVLAVAATVLARRRRSGDLGADPRG